MTTDSNSPVTVLAHTWCCSNLEFNDSGDMPLLAECHRISRRGFTSFIRNQASIVSRNFGLMPVSILPYALSLPTFGGVHIDLFNLNDIGVLLRKHWT